ncbi:energy transducer TonB [Sphingomonas koreensis]|nr:energy transducer TonB [Sphingomonas koreensis]
MRTIRPSPADRITAATLTAAFVIAAGYALIAGLGVRLPAVVTTVPLAAFDVVTPPPPPVAPSDPPPAHTPKPEGAAAPPNITSTPTEIVAPPLPPVIVLPMITAPRAGIGADPSAGAAPVRGPGAGSGGIGNGTGSGGSGNGPGGGGGTPPRQIGGRLRNSDYPRGLGAAGIHGTVGVLFVVSIDGRVTDCEITRSSGNDQLDDTTCDLIIKRFRFEPSRDATGRPVESMVEENHTWAIE